MKTKIAFLSMLLVCISVSVSRGQAQTRDQRLEGIKWQKGPSVGNLKEIAEVRIPEGFIYADGNDTRLIMEAAQNPTSGNEIGFIAPADSNWFVVFEFDATGYIRDDEKTSLDADAMLASIKRATEASNKERQNRGWPTMTIVGWDQKPHYNDATHNLEWAILGQSEGSPVINHNTRLLGRSGVMRVTLVTDPASFAPTLPQFKTILSGFDFKQGNRYAEFRQGDKMAAYGLSALVVGGTAAVATKTGMLKWLWKIIVVAGIACMSFFKKIFARKRDDVASV